MGYIQLIPWYVFKCFIKVARLPTMINFLDSSIAESVLTGTLLARKVIIPEIARAGNIR